jgi:hypothetical protein
LYCDPLSDPIHPANNERFVFLDARSQDFFVDWDSAANDIVARLRREAGRDPYDRALTEDGLELLASWAGSFAPADEPRAAEVADGA